MDSPSAPRSPLANDVNAFNRSVSFMDNPQHTTKTKIATNIVVDLLLVGSVIAAVAASANIVALTALTVVAVVLGATSLSTAIAAFTTVNNPREYFQEIGNSLKVTIPAFLKVVVQALLQALISGLCQRIEKKVAGEERIHVHHHH
jgi:hypothetical protein